jgi:transcriptional regulator with GAF, ATPase, and Fis domain
MTAVVSMDIRRIRANEREHSSPSPGGMSDDAPNSIAFDVSADLLRTIAGVLDVRTVFPRLSDIVKRALPHDCLELLLRDQAGTFRREACSADGFSEQQPCRISEEADAYVIGDLRTSTPPAAKCYAPGLHDRLVAAGYRSVLSVRSVALNRVMRLGFFSKHLQAYEVDDVPTAQHIADHVALAVSHEQLAKAELDRVEVRYRTERLDARVRTLAGGAGAGLGSAPVVGRSDAWQQVLTKAAQVAATDTTVLLQGESGTGKEVIARFIRHSSPRNNGPWVAINCAALPEQLLESELFGHERGAFTGAQQSKPGQIELADRGVLFLDEVSEMSPTAQAKLLRFLQEREFQRLGSTRLLRANVRVIAASNRDLHQAVERGTFREDLFYRLHVFDILLPALRERTSDIPLLADAFLQEIGRSMKRPIATLSQDAQDALIAHTWPGNVRELRNALERAAILCESGVITRHHLALRERPLPASTVDLSTAERRTIERVLQETDWNKARAARRLGITRTQLYVRLRRYALEHPATA